MTVTRTPDEAVEALSASCLPCELQAQMRAVEQEIPSSDPSDVADWEGVLTYEGQMTGDGRYIEHGALKWGEDPIPLRWAAQDNGAHAGAVVVGLITSIERREDGAIFAKGHFDLGSENGREAARQVSQGLTPGVSVDLDDVAFEVRVAAENGIEGDLEDIDENGRVKQLAMKSDDEVMNTTSGRIRAGTLVAIPAFDTAKIALTAAFNPDQLRVPKGNGELSGRWIDMPGKILDDFGFNTGHNGLQSFLINYKGNNNRKKWAPSEEVGAEARDEALKVNNLFAEAKKASTDLDLSDNKAVKEAVEKTRKAIEAYTALHDRWKKFASADLDAKGKDRVDRTVHAASAQALSDLKDFSSVDFYSDPNFDPTEDTRDSFSPPPLPGLGNSMKRWLGHAPDSGREDVGPSWPLPVEPADAPPEVGVNGLDIVVNGAPFPAIGLVRADNAVHTWPKAMLAEVHGDKIRVTRRDEMGRISKEDLTADDAAKLLQSAGAGPKTVFANATGLPFTAGDIDATGTIDDPIDVRGDIVKAADLIRQGKHIRLNRIDEVGTLVDELVKIAEEAKAKNQTAPDYDLCLVSVPGTNLFCEGNKGIDRIRMPQLGGIPIPGSKADALPRVRGNEVDINKQFRDMLTEGGVKITDETVQSSWLKATQDQLVGTKVAGIAKAMDNASADSSLFESVFVSKDGYIIDGHHRWAAEVARDSEDGILGNEPMKVSMIDIEIGAAIDAANQFAKEWGIAPQDASVSSPTPAGVAASAFPEITTVRGLREAIRFASDPATKAYLQKRAQDLQQEKLIPASWAREDFANWVEKAGGLPQYIKRIAKHLQAKGMTQSHAIATAVNVAKKMCATGDVNFPGKQQVNAGSQAEACAAVADWEAKKAKSSAAVLTAAFNEEQLRVPQGNGELSGRWLDMPDSLIENLITTVSQSIDSTNGKDQQILRDLEDAFTNAQRARDVRYTDAAEHRDLLDSADMRLDAARKVADKRDRTDITASIDDIKANISDVMSVDWGDGGDNLTAGFNPDQARVPSGNGELSGRWIDMPGGVLDRLFEFIPDDIVAKSEHLSVVKDRMADLKDKPNIFKETEEIKYLSEQLQGALTSGEISDTDTHDVEQINDAANTLQDFASVDWYSDPDYDPENPDASTNAGDAPGPADQLPLDVGGEEHQANLKRDRRIREETAKETAKAQAVAEELAKAGNQLKDDDRELPKDVEDQIHAIQEDLLAMDVGDSKVELKKIIDAYRTRVAPRKYKDFGIFLSALALWLHEFLSLAFRPEGRAAKGAEAIKEVLSDPQTGAEQLHPDSSVIQNPIGTLHDFMHASQTLLEMLHHVIKASLVAGAYPLQPPAEWFADPRLDGPTPLRVDADGRVYGHLAVWGTCHTGYANQCVTPPNSATGYGYFKTGSLIASNGAVIPTGVITMDTLHAGKTLSGPSTLAHYEHTGRAVADVAAGEDAYGIWIAGSLRPGVSEDQARTLRGSPLSGDWRRIGGSLELVAALAVNVPGFPIPRPAGLVAGGAMQSLVASGMLAPVVESDKEVTDDSGETLSAADLAYLKRLADRERMQVTNEATALAHRVKAIELAKRVGV